MGQREIYGDIFPSFYIHFRANLPTDASEVGADGSPNPHAAFPQTLANGELQQQERHPFQHEQDQVGNQEGSWTMVMIRSYRTQSVLIYSECGLYVTSNLSVLSSLHESK